MSKTLCERRTSCALNADGECALSEPRLSFKKAYVNCLDQVLAIGVGSAIVETSFIVD